MTFPSRRILMVLVVEVTEWAKNPKPFASDECLSPALGDDFSVGTWPSRSTATCPIEDLLA
jgi:hypothetical protein